MKFRLSLLAALLLTVSYATPRMLAEDQPQSSAQSQSAPQPEPTVQPADPDKVKHNGGESDVDAIGNRNVGCNRGLGNWYSVDSQVKTGQEFARQVEQTQHLLTDPMINEYVNRLGQNLSRNT